MDGPLWLVCQVDSLQDAEESCLSFLELRADGSSMSSSVVEMVRRSGTWRETLCLPLLPPPGEERFSLLLWRWRRNLPDELLAHCTVPMPQSSRQAECVLGGGRLLRVPCFAHAAAPCEERRFGWLHVALRTVREATLSQMGLLYDGPPSAAAATAAPLGPSWRGSAARPSDDASSDASGDVSDDASGASDAVSDAALDGVFDGASDGASASSRPLERVETSPRTGASSPMSSGGSEPASNGAVCSARSRSLSSLGSEPRSAASDDHASPPRRSVRETQRAVESGGGDWGSEEASAAPQEAAEATEAAGTRAARTRAAAATAATPAASVAPAATAATAAPAAAEAKEVAEATEAGSGAAGAEASMKIRGAQPVKPREQRPQRRPEREKRKPAPVPEEERRKLSALVRVAAAPSTSEPREGAGGSCSAGSSVDGAARAPRSPPEARGRQPLSSLRDAAGAKEAQKQTASRFGCRSSPTGKRPKPPPPLLRLRLVDGDEGSGEGGDGADQETPLSRHDKECDSSARAQDSFPYRDPLVGDLLPLRRSVKTGASPGADAHRSLKGAAPRIPPPPADFPSPEQRRRNCQRRLSRPVSSAPAPLPPPAVPPNALPPPPPPPQQADKALRAAEERFVVERMGEAPALSHMELRALRRIAPLFRAVTIARTALQVPQSCDSLRRSSLGDGPVVCAIAIAGAASILRRHMQVTRREAEIRRDGGAIFLADAAIPELEQLCERWEAKAARRQSLAQGLAAGSLDIVAADESAAAVVAVLTADALRGSLAPDQE